MTDQELARALRSLKRTVLMLQTELRHERVDEGLIDAIDQQLERGIASDPRCEGLRAHVDALREDIMTPREELIRDALRACDRLNDAVEGVLALL